MAVTSKQVEHLLCIRRDMRQSLVHGTRQLIKLREVLVVRRPLLGVAPQILDGVEVR